MSLSKKTRFEIFKRDGFKCGYCGRCVSSGITLEVDHIIPKAKGGTDIFENLTTACFECNRGKRDGLIGDKKHSTKAVVDKIKEHQEQMKEYLLLIDECQNIDKIFYEKALKPIFDEFGLDSYPSSWGRSAKYFLKNLEFDDVFESAEIASSMCDNCSSSFIYFCKVCHNKIKGVSFG